MASKVVGETSDKGSSFGVEIDSAKDQRLYVALAPERRRFRFVTSVLFLVVVLALAAFTLSLVAVHYGEATESDNLLRRLFQPFFPPVKGQQPSGRIYTTNRISKIAFGSCTSYYLINQPVWTEGVVKAEPDAWIWMGDFAYVDSARVNCRTYPDHPECNCDTTLLTYPPYACRVGNLTHARDRIRMQLEEPHYQAFLQYMCPFFESGFMLPPEGPSCPKPILGVYDDHDYGIDNGNRHLQNKYEFKNLFLDAIGEPAYSARRSSTQGLQYKYTLNAGGPRGYEIDVFLLDERYERDALPCAVRRDWCETVLEQEEPSSHDYLWCQDFLNTGGISGVGSCCTTDDIWANGWCKDNEGSTDPLWDVACDPSSERYGSMPLQVDEETQKLKLKDTYDDLSQLSETSTFCEVLGPKQRTWLRNELQESFAPLKLVVSGSVIFSNAAYVGWEGACSGDDFECYKSAQANLIHILDSVDQGCVIILTGDYHVSDLVSVNSGDDTPYSPYFPTANLKKPLHQVMSSGLTPSTAYLADDPASCNDWAKDDIGLRPLGECAVVATPSFGSLEMDWRRNRVTFRHHSIESGNVATDVMGNKQELTVDLKTCQMI